ncbi:pirin family protein [Catenovulum maritimum]|uniref:Quercetin 2,3-dioxygenase n=1 Tax=Catenovulum maritimum TaxID=1513271 RepID=A0A0J8GWW7_9ALTE|nr:pirin family protein [Catenovulum maritimum]KMT65774.1 quercetin 2,3-dioxygenase [Catenovulum maritimum]
MSTQNKPRQVIEKITARAASDGAGVKLLRVFSGPRAERFDPFLMLDEFGSESADDYIAGFPAHPHRGFETITYMLAGKMEHQDHMGNVGLLSDGGVQWMTAGRGVIHSEMPKQTQGKMHGFQLWLNLAAEDKMQAAGYQDIPASEIPNYEFDGFKLTAIAGETNVNDRAVAGRMQQVKTLPIYLDFEVEETLDIEVDIADGFNCFIYCFQGEVKIGADQTILASQNLARLNQSGKLKLTAAAQSRFLCIAGKPLGESIVQHGPFVMNSTEEIEQAIKDYQSGTLVD